MSNNSGVWPPPKPASPPARPLDTHALGERAVPTSEAALGNHFTSFRADSSASLALNIHLPFCPSRCLSCDRVAVVEHQPKELDHYVVNLERELARAAELLGERSLSHVHFGGGSPNHLSELALATIFSHISRHFSVSDGTHFSMELNPRRTSRAQLNFLKGLGIEHIKLEVRDVDATVQREIGRIHSQELLEDVISIANAVNFESISMDYLIGLPGQSAASCQQSIDAVVSLGPDWLVCQPFSRREGVFPHQIAVDVQQLPSLADRLVMFNHVEQHMTGAGYEWVGLNVFAKPDHELAVAQREGTLAFNVLGYGTDANLNIMGIGLGALSELSTQVLQNHTDLASWHRLVEAGSLSVASAVFADDSETLQRKVMRNLMCRQSVSVSALTNAQQEAWMSPLIGQGYLEKKAEQFRLTDVGLSLLPHTWTDSSPVFRAF